MNIFLIFNPFSGKARTGSVLPEDILSCAKESGLSAEITHLKPCPEPRLKQDFDPDSELKKEIVEAQKRGFKIVAACGGDGTVSAVFKMLSGLSPTLGIIPLGTQNNIARSLSIPLDLPGAMDVLKTGKQMRIDSGQATFGSVRTPFLEICSVGFASSIFPSADKIQHGHPEKLGDLLAKLISCAPAQFQIMLNEKESFTGSGYAVLVTNMIYAGRQCRLGDARAFHDGLLDVIFFGELPKLSLMRYALHKFGALRNTDPKIHRFRAKSVDISAYPPMPVMLDGILLGEGPVRAEVNSKSLCVLTKQPMSANRRVIKE
jgi:diacylglycerol kinase (ATP)